MHLRAWSTILRIYFKTLHSHTLVTMLQILTTATTIRVNGYIDLSHHLNGEV